MDNDSVIISFIFITHLFLICWAVLWFMQMSYVLYNTFFLICLLWSIHESKSSGPLFISFMINGMSIALDVAFIIIIWSDYYSGYRFVLSILATIVNLVYRVFTTLIIYRILSKRRQFESNVENFGSITRDITKYFSFQRTVSPPPQDRPAQQQP